MSLRVVSLAMFTLLLAGCDNGKITLPGSGKTEVTKTIMHCDDGQTLEATYYNNDPNALAVVKKGDNPEYVLVNVIAGSGAKYDGNIYEWWTKGSTGTFTDLMEQKSTECTE